MAKNKKSTRPINEMDVESVVTRELPVLTTGTDAGFFDYADEKCLNYTYLFHQLYERADECEDKAFIEEMKARFFVSTIEYRSCRTDATALRQSEIELDEQRQDKIMSLQDMINDEDCTEEERFKYNRKIARLLRQMNQNAVFGGRQKLRLLTKAYNRIKKAEINIPKLQKEISELEKSLSSGMLSRRDEKRTKYHIESKKRTINDYRERAENSRKRIPKLKQDLKESRILSASLMGEANQKGNRFVEFDLENGIFVFKITKNKSYTVKVKIIDGFKEELKKVQKLIDAKGISVTVRFSRDMIKIQYDVAVVNGYSVDEKSRRAEVKEIKKEEFPEDIEKEKIKEVYKKYYAQQKSNMLLGKIEGRCMSIDMNPGEIGYAILELDDSRESGFRIIAAGRISWMCLMRRHKKKSSSSYAIHLNNKRKNAISLTLKKLFDIAEQYQCSEFIIEDLDFTDDVNDKTKQSNRKCKNLWYRTMTDEIINRRCAETGIRLVKTNACYTSFIGNIKYGFCDPTNAAIEIGRRGLMRYKSGSFYPQMTQEDVDTMTRVADNGDRGDAHTFTHESWKSAYKSCKVKYTKKEDFEHRYRASLSECQKPFETRSRYYNSGISLTYFTSL